jgi:hypothetical protein
MAPAPMMDSSMHMGDSAKMADTSHKDETR